MTLCFSKHGPEFPSELIDALSAGEVVFLCGSGISVPQLPDFKTLVDQTYKRLDVDKDAAEERSYEGQRYEEVLGALGRRLADPEAMVRTVSEQLVVPSEPQLNKHQTILRLSRDLNNRVLTVTTNFDTLLERALENSPNRDRQKSFAGQALPAPGGPNFSGIIHLHGRLGDPELDLEATSLVLTSSDYGDAYMRSGWASRFLFDLARCKTLVLIGYSANDAPIRYFLNVLEADRARFPDLHQVYAFDAYERDPIEAQTGWGTLAVKPLPYCKFNPANGDPDHSPLWDDLCQLADMVERPKQSREKLTQRILTGNSSTLTDQQLSELSWLFSDRNDLWPVALKTLSDPSWFKVFQENKLWSTKDAAWVIAAWIANNFESAQSYRTAVEWYTILGNDFISRLEQRLQQNPPVSPFWLKSWRVFVSLQPAEHSDAFEQEAYNLNWKLQSGQILDSDLRQSIALLAPMLVARRPWQRNVQDIDESELDEPRLSNLVNLELRVADDTSAADIIKALDKLDGYEMRILELGNQALSSSLQQSVDLGMIVDDFDWSDFSVPSIEEHAQNAHHNGVIFLVRTIMNTFPKALKFNRDRALTQAAQWRTWPGRIGARMLLHSARDPVAFSGDDALRLLLQLKDTDFWIIRRELALVLRDRASEAKKELVNEVEARIRNSGEAFYARYSLEEDQVDWRAHARDKDVWLRLKMLDAAGAVSTAGRTELDAIVLRRPHLDRDIEDKDFFGSYSYGVRNIVGDSGPILEAAPDDRLKVAAELRISRDIDMQLGWRSYCQSDPKGAFDTLAFAELTKPNIALWGDLLSVLAQSNEENNATLRDQLSVESLSLLEDLNKLDLKPIAASIIDLLLFRSRGCIKNLENWCDRLWAAVQLVEHEADFEKDIGMTAINSAAGRLTEILVKELNHTRETDGQYEARQRKRLELIVTDKSQAGILGRAVLVQNFAFMHSVAAELVEKHLMRRLASDTDEARALRAVMVSQSEITPEVTKVASDIVLRGVIETQAISSFSEQIASNILRAALASLRGNDPDLWGISESDVSRTLRESPFNIRCGALSVLARWMQNDEEGGEEAWEKMVEPFFERVWPKESCFIDDAFNHDLMSIVICSGKHFPIALKKLRPYFSLYSGRRASTYPIKNSQAPENFPSEVLDLLWLVFGAKGSVSYDVPKLLDRIKEADPNIEVDRRFQSLEQLTIRYS
ncbi:SIR2 family protein [Thalassospira lucentensis]|uniref:SIR2 family protein n=1 Tax=Thalassospira lucentensis TaxID=168935 RepID=UPI00041EB40C|nr:SIR2 family protein [Thalassospira lucentensis]RCK26288.1 hypothetical protein TH1_12490 [Thalassospira lucentensis MCCC 1A00383 = DSM 14000]